MATSGNFVFQFTNSTGTSNLSLAASTSDSPAQYFRNFSTVFGTGSGNKFYYGIRHRNTPEFEVGVGYMTDSTTMVRDSVIESSNSNSAVNFSSGTKDVISDIPASLQNLLTQLSFTAGKTLTLSDNETLSGTNTGDYKATTVISASAIDWSLANTFSKSIGSTNTTFTFSNTTDGQVIVVAITATSGTVTWPTTKWAAGTVPTQTASGTDVYTFVKVGSTFYGSVVQAMA